MNPCTPEPWQVDLNQPCPECFREEDGKWFYPCPSDDCVLHDPRLIAAAPDLLGALQNLVADWERVQGRPIPEDHEAKAAIKKAISNP